MLSYRHAFHAGNHADVLKHFVLMQVLHYFNQKDKPYWMIDTHAGAGLYTLNSGFSAKNAEYETGIKRLLAATHLPQELKQFTQLIQSFNANNKLELYPGSPTIAQKLIRRDDKLRLFELHPSDFKLLSENFASKSKQTNIEMQNGFAGVKACLPPPPKRAVILIDPPYELKEDYQLVVKCMQDSLQRFATGTYLIWYPLLQRPEPLNMVSALKSLCPNNYLDVTLSVQAPADDGFGMFGSGMFIVNPPYTLPNILNETLPTLTKLLAIDENAEHTLASQIT